MTTYLDKAGREVRVTKLPPGEAIGARDIATEKDHTMKARKTWVRRMNAGPPKRSSFEDCASLPPEPPSLWQSEAFPLLKLEEYPLQLAEFPIPTLEACPLQLNDYPLQLLSPDDYPLRLLSVDDSALQLLSFDDSALLVSFGDFSSRLGDEPVSARLKRRTRARNQNPSRAATSSCRRPRRT
jgi:hypothetical protein